MLYVTTRNNRDAFTANRVMREMRCPDGGMYLPFRHPRFSEDDLEELLQKPFVQCVAEVLNKLFNTKLTGWDVDFCIGRYPVHLESLKHRIFLAESWHTPGLRFAWIVKALASKLCGDVSEPTDWMNIAIRASVLFGVWAELKRCGIDYADISVVSGDFSMPISAWYARHWGLPIGNIVCCCNENNGIWELFSHGQMRTDSVSIQTMIPAADITLAVDLERLIYECGGISETMQFLDAYRKGSVYSPGDSILAKLRKGMHVNVVSTQRLETTVPSVYRTHGYLMSPCTALSYAGLLDYRAKTGSAGPAVVWSEESPADDVKTVAALMGIAEEQILQIL